MENQKGLGDLVAYAFATVGITKGRVSLVARVVGIEDCGCEKRQKWLNQFGYSLGIGAPHDIPHRPR